MNERIPGHDVSMLQVCSEPGCSTRTIGAFCVAHEPAAPQRVFPRGRPYRLKHREMLASVGRIGRTTDREVVLLDGAA